LRIYTIGFTKKPAERFFSLLRDHSVQRLLDIRLHPGGQLAGFAKQDDLRYFLQELAHCGYAHLSELAPTDEILSEYRKDHKWPRYTERFEALMDERGIPDRLDRIMFEQEICCLLCSEDTPEKCHRRLVAERIAAHWDDVEIVHLI
jgi:uncharacterized protein (DUF488 family)